MSRRIEVTVSVIAAVLLLAVLAGMVGLLYARPATAQTSAGVPGMPQITVVGHGEVKGRPDTATVQIGVETDGATAQEALARNNEQAQAIIAKLKELNVSDADIQTSNFNIYPTYNNDGRQVTGYHVSNSVMVKIRNLDQAGTLLDQVVQAGANSVYGINFSVENPQELLDQAREQAIKDAQARAARMATAAGASVGEVLVINENVGSPPVVPMPMMRGEAADSMAAVPVQPGEQNFTVDVQVTFALR